MRGLDSLIAEARITDFVYSSELATHGVNDCRVGKLPNVVLLSLPVPPSLILLILPPRRSCSHLTMYTQFGDCVCVVQTLVSKSVQSRQAVKCEGRATFDNRYSTVP